MFFECPPARQVWALSKIPLNPLSGQRWFSTLPSFDGLLGAKNVRACLSPLHSKVEALVWVMECMRKFKTVSGYVCNILFSIGEDGFGTGRIDSIWNLYGKH